MKSYSLIQPLFFILVLLITLPLIGCSKSKPNRSIIEKHCHDKILEQIKSRPLSRLERRFFKDGKARGILKAEQLSPKGFAEGVSSATASSFIQEFVFIDQKGQKVRLIRNSSNGGIEINGPNIVSPLIQCKVIWGLFKGKVMKESLKVIMVTQDKLQQKMLELETMMDSSL